MSKFKFLGKSSSSDSESDDDVKFISCLAKGATMLISKQNAKMSNPNVTTGHLVSGLTNGTSQQVYTRKSESPASLQGPPRGFGSASSDLGEASGSQSVKRKLNFLLLDDSNTNSGSVKGSNFDTIRKNALHNSTSRWGGTNRLTILSESKKLMESSDEEDKFSKFLIRKPKQIRKKFEDKKTSGQSSNLKISSSDEETDIIHRQLIEQLKQNFSSQKKEKQDKRKSVTVKQETSAKKLVKPASNISGCGTKRKRKTDVSLRAANTTTTPGESSDSQSRKLVSKTRKRKVRKVESSDEDESDDEYVEERKRKDLINVKNKNRRKVILKPKEVSDSSSDSDSEEVDLPKIAPRSNKQKHDRTAALTSAKVNRKYRANSHEIEYKERKPEPAQNGIKKSFLTVQDSITGHSLSPNALKSDLKSQRLNPPSNSKVSFGQVDSDFPPSLNNMEKSDSRLESKVSGLSNALAQVEDLENEEELEIDVKEIVNLEVESDSTTDSESLFTESFEVSCDRNLQLYKTYNNAEMNGDSIVMPKGNIKRNAIHCPVDEHEEYEQYYPGVFTSFDFRHENLLVVLLRMSPHTIRPFEMSDRTGAIVFLVTKGHVLLKTFDNDEAPDENGKYSFTPKLIRVGKYAIVPKGVPYSLENRSDFHSRITSIIMND